MQLNDTTAAILVFLMALGGTCLLQALFAKLFPWFVSHERKEGRYRFEDLTKVNPSSTKLPNVGGIAALISLSTALIVSTLLGFTDANFRWFLLPVWCYGLIGFLDDVRKFRGQGQSERTRLVLIFIGSVIVATVLYTRMGFNEPFPPYSNASALFFIPLVWLFWWYFLATTLTTVTTLSVGFSDGVDGLLGGLWFIASLAYAIFTTVNRAQIASDISIALCGAGLGFLLFNLPSRWQAGQPRSKRPARVYLGETGALMVGGAFSMLALLSQTEFIWFLIGGVFVLEGGSAFYQAKIATKIFRRFLILTRHREHRKEVPHTEFPLPFLATPLHSHFDLLGMGRYRVVQIMWALGLAFAIIGLWAALASELFVKVIAFLSGVGLMMLVWQWGAWTRNVFIGFYPEERGNGRCLALFRGKPLEIFGLKLYWMEERVPLSEADAERFGLLVNLVMFRAMNKDDARLALGYIFYRCERYADALSFWDKVRLKSLEIRSDLHALYRDAQERVRAAAPALPAPDTKAADLEQLPAGQSSPAGAALLGGVHG